MMKRTLWTRKRTKTTRTIDNGFNKNDISHKLQFVFLFLFRSCDPLQQLEIVKLFQIVKPSSHLSTTEEPSIEIYYCLDGTLDSFKLHKDSNGFFWDTLDLKYLVNIDE